MTTEPINRACLIWQGFRHRWLRLPHRMGDIANYLKDDAVAIIGTAPPKQLATIESTAYCTFMPGEDGDQGEIATYYRPISHNGVGVKRGYWTLSFTDRADDRQADKRASASHHETCQISTQNDELNWGEIEQVAVILRGFAIDLRNADNGESGYIWPTLLRLRLGEYALSADHTAIDCSFDVDVMREDSPDPFKGQTDRVQYDIQIYYTVIAGASADFQSGNRKTYATSDRSFVGGPAALSDCLALHPSVDAAITAITGFTFSIHSEQDRDGRYLNCYELRVADEPIDAGAKHLTVYLGFLAPDWLTTSAARYDASVETLQLMFKNQPLTLACTQHADMSVCTETGLAWACPGGVRTSDAAHVSHTLHGTASL